jgi:hypothetical protein
MITNGTHRGKGPRHNPSLCGLTGQDGSHLCPGCAFQWQSMGCNRENGENRDNRDNRGLPPKGGVRDSGPQHGPHDAHGAPRPHPTHDAPDAPGAGNARHDHDAREAPSPLSLFSLLHHDLFHTLPQHPGQWERALFRLARELKAVMPDARPNDLRPVVREWHERTLTVVGDKAFADTWSLFLAKWKKVRVPAGNNPVDEAFERALASPPPAKAVELYGQGPIVKLAALCRELQRTAGEEEFYIDCRKAGKKIGVHHTTAWHYLNTLCADDILKAGAKGSQATAKAPGKASRFRYVGD